MALAPRNDFLVWAGGGNANVLLQSDYAGATNLTSGVVAGKANGQQANKTWRQTSIMASMIAKFINDTIAADVIDDGTIATIEQNFIAAIKSQFVIPNTGVVPGTYGPTVQISVEADGRVTALANGSLPPSGGVTVGTYVGATVSVGATGLVTGISSVAYGQIGGQNRWQLSNYFQQGVIATGVDAGAMQMRMTLGETTGYGVGWRMDNTNVYLLMTNNNQPLGVYNALRPFWVTLATGAVHFDGSAAGVTFGGAITATGGISSTNGNVSAPAGTVSGAAVTSSNTMTAQGNVNFHGSLQVDGSITTINSGSNIVAGNGRLRAALGAYGSGDNAAGVILNDFLLASNSAGGYCRLPNGVILQGGLQTSITGYDTFNFPIAFPNGIFTIVGVDDGLGIADIGIPVPNLAQFQLATGYNHGSTPTYFGGVGVRWIAWGY